MKRNKKLQRSTPSSVNSILLVTFTVLLLIVVAVLSVTQYSLLSGSYAEQLCSEEVALSKEIYATVKDAESSQNPASFAVLNAYLQDKDAKSSFAVYLVDEDGWVIGPRDDLSAKPEQKFEREVASLKRRLDKRTNGKSGTAIVYEEKGVYYVATAVDYLDSRIYLMVFGSAELSPRVRGVMITQIVLVSIGVIGVSALVLGHISSKISSPLSQLSRSAKLLGKGNFDVKFENGDGYCKEINELAQSLDETREEISKSDRMQKELIANVSHDFKTPLTMIKAYASMIQDFSGEDPEKRNKHCQVIIDESDRLASLVGDLLDVSKISSGITVLKPVVFDLSEFTQSIAERFRYLEETKGYTIETEILPNLFTEGDKDKIGQVLYNLIGNAVNYTGEDKKITVRLMKDRNCIRFDVTDTGRGIRKEELTTIWDRYYRSEETHKRPVQGTGLGLSIVKAILTRHQFSFGVNSEYGKGSCFYVEFPPRTARSIQQKTEE